MRDVIWARDWMRSVLLFCLDLQVRLIINDSVWFILIYEVENSIANHPKNHHKSVALNHPPRVGCLWLRLPHQSDFLHIGCRSIWLLGLAHPVWSRMARCMRRRSGSPRHRSLERWRWSQSAMEAMRLLMPTVWRRSATYLVMKVTGSISFRANEKKDWRKGFSSLDLSSNATICQPLIAVFPTLVHQYRGNDRHRIFVVPARWKTLWRSRTLISRESTPDPAGWIIVTCDVTETMVRKENYPFFTLFSGEWIIRLDTELDQHWGIHHASERFGFCDHCLGCSSGDVLFLCLGQCMTCHVLAQIASLTTADPIDTTVFCSLHILKHPWCSFIVGRCSDYEKTVKVDRRPPVYPFAWV